MSQELKETVTLEEVEKEDAKLIERELEKRRQETLSKLDEIDQPPQTYNYLDMGEHEGVWYYGFIGRARDNIIVTSDYQIHRLTKGEIQGQKYLIDEISQEFGLNYKNLLGDIAPFWRFKNSKYSITSFVKKEIPILNKEDIYNEVKQEIKHFMDFGDEPEIADVQACFVMVSYCYEMFNSLGHLFFNAPKESGKSKNAKLLRFMSFRGYDVGAGAGLTPAAFYRVLEQNRGTIVFDEYEQAGGEAEKIINQILNSAIQKDQAYIIKNIQKNDDWTPTKFNVFSPKIICNISGLNEVTFSRVIPIKLLKTPNSSAFGKRKPKESDFLELRDKLHVFVMQYHKEIKEFYNKYSFNLSNRDEDIWKPICSMAKFFGDDKEASVLRYVDKCKEEKANVDSPELTLFIGVYQRVNDEGDYYRPLDIANWFDVDQFSWIKNPSYWIGRILTNYKIKGRREGSGKHYYLSKPIVANIIKRYWSDSFSDITTLTTQYTLTT